MTLAGPCVHDAHRATAANQYGRPDFMLLHRLHPVGGTVALPCDISTPEVHKPRELDDHSCEVDVLNSAYWSHKTRIADAHMVSIWLVALPCTM